MAALALGALALILFLLLGRAFLGADPKALAKGARFTGAGLLGLAAVALALVDRVSLAFVVGSMAWGLFSGGHLWPGGWAYALRHRSRGRTAPPPGGQKTSVHTDWLEVELDHDTGAMRGRVLRGRFKGRSLEGLSQADASALYRESAPDDPETARLLEAYLDRSFGAGWRAASQGSQQRGEGRARPDGGMSREEAFKILGLDPGAGPDDIRAAHRKLMMQNHPDRGGSDYLAAKINEAKDFLLA